MSSLAGDTSRRFNAGFWSSAKSFYLPVGRLIDPAGVRGYPIDLRVKTEIPRERLFRSGALIVGVAQYGLGSYERYLAGEGDQWLEAALATGRHMLSIQSDDGAWRELKDYPHTFPLRSPWVSGITQGQGASLMVRMHLLTGEQQFADAARAALVTLGTPQSRGGCRGELNGAPWPEEYPTTPQSHVLNGAIYAVFGMRDVALGLHDDSAREQFDAGYDSLVRNLEVFDTGAWSLYSLYPHPILNRASSFYHSLHVNQLTALHAMQPHLELERVSARWAAYAASRAHAARAFAWKAAFRLTVPRNPVFARTLPWNRLPA
jgi:hypothetical protein